jgi:hypothetical protein
LKPHPLLVVERDARAAALAAFRQLNLAPHFGGWDAPPIASSN